MNILTGDFVNVAAILAGGGVGCVIAAFAARLGKARKRSNDSKDCNGKDRKGNRSKSLKDTLLQGLSLCVIMIGINGVVGGVFAQNGADGTAQFRELDTLVIILSMVLGILIGEGLQLDAGLQRLGDWIGKKCGSAAAVASEDGEGAGKSVSQGFVTASLLFCVGAMSIVGALNSGISLDHTVLYTKAMLDGFIAVILASTLGWGVLLSAVPVLVYQGAIALLAEVLSPLLTTACIVQMNCVGSLLIIGIGLNMLGLIKMKVMNGVPAIFLPIFLCLFL